MFQNYLHQFILIGLYCLVHSNPYLYQQPQNSFYRPALFYPDSYFAAQSRQIQSYAIPSSMPKWSSSNYYKNNKVAFQRQPYSVWSYQQNNIHRWPQSTYNYFNEQPNLQVQSESYNRPIYRKQNHIKKINNPVNYHKKFEFLESKKKKSQICKALGEQCYGFEPYIPENCCKGYVCSHNTKSIIGVCEKKVAIKVQTSPKSNIVQRPLTTEELLGDSI